MSPEYLVIPTNHGTIKDHKIVPQRLRVQTEETRDLCRPEIIQFLHEKEGSRHNEYVKNL